MSKATPSGQEATDASSLLIKDAEHFAFSVPTAGIATVENRRHDDPAEHTYAVNVDENGETVGCSCPADEYHPGKCKHRQAVENTPAVVLAASAESEETSA